MRFRGGAAIRSRAGFALEAAYKQDHTDPEMKTVVRIYLAVMLSMVLALTAQGLAQSRGVSMAQGQMEICTGTGPVMVYVDADGQPTQAPHYCPDFALTLLSALGVADITAPRGPAGMSVNGAKGYAQVPTAVVLRASARAPPALI
ncbi:hypothetical protein [Phaeobacter sp. NW0010-22]|uniref:hypothetical protein n=1 Tax=Phaeobacter sp. NW0010-22 TaxID=3135907 RepID=UPI00310532BC